MQHPVLIIIPAHNEELSIKNVLLEIRSQFAYQILVIDDYSSDNTAKIARQAGAKVFSLPVQLGAWGSTQTGIRYAHKMGFKTALSIDADGQHPVQEINKLLAALEENRADVIIGSCCSRGSKQRRLAWQIFRKLLRIPIQDITSGFRAYNHRAIQALVSKGATILDYQDVGVISLLARYNLTFTEIPVNMQIRKNGHSRIFSSWPAVSHYMLTSLSLLLSKFSLIRKKCLIENK